MSGAVQGLAQVRQRAVPLAGRAAAADPWQVDSAEGATDRIVDVWVRETSTAVRTDTAAEAEALDLHERERWARFVDARDAAAYLELHLLARSEIGRLVGRAPAALRF